MNVLLALFEGLTRLNRNNIPELAGAKSVEISEDHLVYTFHLKEHYWSNGDLVTSFDYLHAWRSILDPKFPAAFAYKFYAIENAIAIKEGRAPLESLGVFAPDLETLIIKLVHPAPYFLEQIALPTFYPLHSKTIEGSGPLFISNGPFLLDRWEHESEIILKKNPLYWDQQAVSLDTVHLAMIPDNTTEFYMFENGELDWAGSPLSTLPLEFIPALMQEKKLNIYDTNGIYYFKLNTLAPPLNNVKIRKALALAINRQEIVDHILQANQTIATALVPTLPGVEHETLFADGDRVLAQRLFAEGLKEENLESFPSLTLSYNTCSQHQKIAQAIQHQWKDVLGIWVNLESCDWKVYLPKINKLDYEIGRMGWIGEHSDPISYLAPFKQKNNPHIGGHNETGWEDPEFAKLLDLAERELDPTKRIQFLKEAEAILVEQMPVIPIYFLNYAYLKKPYVQDVILSPLGTIDFKEAKIKR